MNTNLREGQSNLIFKNQKGDKAMAKQRYFESDNGKDLFKKLDEFLNKGRNKNQRTYANNTRILRGEGCISVEYHETDIVTVHADGKMVLDSGGYSTVTTKERINWFLPVGYRIYQEKWEWYITYKQQSRMLFQSGMVLFA